MGKTVCAVSVVIRKVDMFKYFLYVIETSDADGASDQANRESLLGNDGYMIMSTLTMKVVCGT